MNFFSLKLRRYTIQRLIAVFIGILISLFLRFNFLKCNFNIKSSSIYFNQQYKELFFIGVLTSKEVVDKKVKSVFETWGKDVPGNILFFSSEVNSTKDDQKLPIINLDKVDDLFTMRNKAFKMLKYMHKYYIDKFEWFIRVDDDVYIRSEKLEVFLRSLNSSKLQFIGLPQSEINENYCNDGIGLIMSRETLNYIIPYIDICLNNTKSNLNISNSDISSCINNYIDLPCTNAYEMDEIFIDDNIYIMDRKIVTNEVSNSIFLHPVNLDDQYSIHKYFNILKIMELKQNLLKLNRKILKTKAELEKKIINKELNEPILKSIKLKKDQRRQEFTYFTYAVNSATYMEPRSGIEGYWKKAFRDNTKQINEQLNKKKANEDFEYTFKSIYQGYRRPHPLYGIDYIFDVLLDNYIKNSTGEYNNEVIERVYIRQTYNDMIFRDNFTALYHNSSLVKKNKNLFDYFLSLFSSLIKTNKKTNVQNKILKDDKAKMNYEIDSSIKNITVHLVVPLAGRLEVFKRFIENVEIECLITNENVKIAFVYFFENKTKEDDEIFKSINEIILNMNIKYLNTYLQLIKINKKFSRSIACMTGARFFQNNSLIAFVDIDILFDREFLLRVRLNTIKGKQAYFPIVFSEYDPEPDIFKDDIEYIGLKSDDFKSHFNIHSDIGYWRFHGFGMSSIYNNDLESVGGFDTNIDGWGLEDGDLYEKFSRSNFIIFRSPDPGLIHVYHKIKCDPKLSRRQLNDCFGTMKTSIASTEQLARVILRRNFYSIGPTLAPSYRKSPFIIKKIF